MKILIFTCFSFLILSCSKAKEIKENSIVSEGGTALDVLSRAPGVVVSQDGDLSIRGQQGVAVMINGKLTQLSQKELANYLKSTTSSNIKQLLELNSKN